MREAQKMDAALHRDQFCLGRISKHFNFLFRVGRTEHNIICSLMPVRSLEEYKHS